MTNAMPLKRTRVSYLQMTTRYLYLLHVIVSRIIMGGISFQTSDVTDSEDIIEVS